MIFINSTALCTYIFLRSLRKKKKIGKYVQIQNADEASLAGRQLAETAAQNTEL